MFPETEEVTQQLKEILGAACMDMGGFKPNQREQALSKAVNYLSTQMVLMAKIEDKDERKGCLTSVLEKATGILKTHKTEQQ